MKLSYVAIFKYLFLTKKFNFFSGPCIWCEGVLPFQQRVHWIESHCRCIRRDCWFLLW